MSHRSLGPDRAENMLRTFLSGAVTQGFVALAALSVCPQLYGQAAENKPMPGFLPFPIKVDMGQRFNPSDSKGKISMERFKLSAGTKNLTMQYSNQAPSILAGKQFQALPAGYEMVELLLKRKWGSIHGFHSTGYNARLIAPNAARRLSGASLEIPKSFFGTHFSGHLLEASPAEQDAASKLNPPPSRKGSQAILTIARDFKKGFKLRSEFTQSWQRLKPNAKSAESGRGIHTVLTGNILKAETNLTFRSQDQDLSNPAAPVPGRGRRLLILDVRRTYRKHQFQYSSQLDSQAAMRTLHLPFVDLRQQSVRWIYSPKILPQISAIQTWSSQGSPGQQEVEGNLRLSLNKAMKRCTLGLAYLHGTRINDLTFRPLWERTGLVGDASLEVRKNRRLNFRYESSDLLLVPSSQMLASEVLQFNTRLSYRGDRLAFTPVLDFRRQQDNQGKLNSSLVNLVLSALLKLPRYIPGTDLLITVNSRRFSAVGRPQQMATGFVVQWNFKRS